MTDYYSSNRTQAAAYRAQLVQRLDTLFAPETLPPAADENLQPFYLDFKKRVQGFVEEETARQQEELIHSDNSHLLLLKRTALVDTVVQRAFYLGLWLFNQRESTSLRENDLPVALVARGSYGREELSFCSDVELKVIFRESGDAKSVSQATQVVSFFEYLFVFQDIFPASARTGCAVLDTDGQKLDDTTLASLISLLENRHVAGNEMVSREFHSSIQTACLLHRDKLIEYCERYKGLYEVQNTVFRQEPNLRDEMSRIFWALCVARLSHAIVPMNLFEVLLALYQQKLISAPAFKRAQFALNFLMRVRLALHCHQKGSQRDLLTYEVREKVAQALGFQVKEFFNEYFFNSVLPLKRYARDLFWESLTPDSRKVKALSQDFAVNEENQIIFSPERAEYFWESPRHMLELFTWVARKNYSLSYPVIRAVEQNIDRFSPLFQSVEQGDELQDIFQTILRGKYFAKAFRYLHEFGLLSQYFVPEFQNLSGMLQDIYVHLFPTDIHILHALEALNRLDNDPTADAFLVDLYQSLKDKSTLRLAVMVHDIGKGLKTAGENEELVGARAVPGILNKLGYGGNLKMVRDIAFLVEKHLMMRDLMMLDPDEDDTYEMIWDLVNKDVERLKMLIILTYADRAATKMNMSQTQIDQLKYFYQNTLHHKKRESVSWPVKNEFLRMIRLPRDMQAELEIYNEFKKSRDGFSSELFFKPDQPSELVVCTRDQGGLLFKVATILAFNHLSIVDARIHTHGDNVFDVFKIWESGQKPIDFSNFFVIQKKIKEELRKVFVGKLPVSELYRGRSLTTQQGTERFPEVKLKVSIIGRAVKLETHDILGTMMMETKVFSQLNMQIQRAVINSHYDTASNIFYLRPEDVHEIMKNEERFKSHLKTALEPLIRNEPVFPDSPAEVA